MNESLRAAAEDLLDALVWLADDALAMRRIPAHDPAASPDQGPEPEAAAHAQRLLSALGEPAEPADPPELQAADAPQGLAPATALAPAAIPDLLFPPPYLRQDRSG